VTPECRVIVRPEPRIKLRDDDLLVETRYFHIACRNLTLPGEISFVNFSSDSLAISERLRTPGKERWIEGGFLAPLSGAAVGAYSPADLFLRGCSSGRVLALQGGLMRRMGTYSSSIVLQLLSVLHGRERSATGGAAVGHCWASEV
jgi:hypothetical protein